METVVWLCRGYRDSVTRNYTYSFMGCTYQLQDNYYYTVVVSQKSAPQYRPRNTVVNVVLIMGNPRKIPQKFWETPLYVIGDTGKCR